MHHDFSAGVIRPTGVTHPCWRRPRRTKQAPDELVAAAVFHLDGLLSFLAKVALNSWELPTSQVQLQLGASPRGATFSRYGFSFRPSGRHGQETSWRVER